MKTGRLAAWMLAMVVVIAACIGYSPPNNGRVVVFDLGHLAASASWRTPGFFGTALGEGIDAGSIGPCTAASFRFGPGDHIITITSPADILSFVLHAAPYGQPGVVATYAIDAGGHITQVNPETMPANGTCPP